MSVASTPLRSLQREHALLLLTPDEFSHLVRQGRLPLPGRHFDHFSRVMRRHNTWRALIGNGLGRLALCEVQKGTIVLADENIEDFPRNSPMVTLIQAWPKPKALALILQKAAELGASQIVLVSSERSALPSEKTERMEAILENACMQAYNLYKPSVLQRDLTDQANFAHGEFFFGDIQGSVKIRNLAATGAQAVTFINGPEGGFSARETAWLRERATGVLLSENVLRSETAAIIALGHFCQSP